MCTVYTVYKKDPPQVLQLQPQRQVSVRDVRPDEVAGACGTGSSNLAHSARAKHPDVWPAQFHAGCERRGKRWLEYHIMRAYETVAATWAGVICCDFDLVDLFGIPGARTGRGQRILEGVEDSCAAGTFSDAIDATGTAKSNGNSHSSQPCYEAANGNARAATANREQRFRGAQEAVTQRAAGTEGGPTNGRGRQHWDAGL